MIRAIFILLILSFFSSCNLDCAEKKTGSYRWSTSKQFSKQNGLYKLQMHSNKSTIVLSDSSVLKIIDAWVEDAWHYACIDNDPVIQTDTFLHLVVLSDYKNDTSNYFFYDGSIGMRIGSTSSFIYDLSDTLTLLLRNGNVVIDTIHFTATQKIRS